MAEVYEFDATEDPPSTLDIEVFDYDGPFSEAESLGHTAINFLKTKSNDYADVWLPLNGKYAQSQGARLHVRVLLTNTKNGDVPLEYINKVEKEAGTKVCYESFLVLDHVCMVDMIELLPSIRSVYCPVVL